MGLLDEAIREHLELKRRRGADGAEISRQEKEAFGAGAPVAEAPHPDDRDHEAASPALRAAPEPAHEPEPVHEQPTRLHHEADEPAPDRDALRPDPDAVHHEPATGHHEPVAHHHETELETEPPRPHGDPADELGHIAEPVRDEPAAPEPVGQPTREFDLDEVRAASGAEPEVVPADEEPEGEDVLEETPEFLQETPEHDRLWFEQRPPRDFNF
jgi:hypothetical protein